MFLFPWTIYKLCNRSAETEMNHEPGNPQCVCKTCAINAKIIKPVDKTGSKVSFCNILFVLMWILFLYLVVQLPSMQTGELTTFEPYTILGIEKNADEAMIKRAYKKQSMIYHPDKNRDDPDTPIREDKLAEEKFMLIAKAYNTLTDPATKEKMEKFGNPDGYQGVSMTIGLPKFLTAKENELPVLLLYFLLLVVLPPIGVWMWWSSAKTNTTQGVSRRTLQRQFEYITDSMMPKNLVEVLAVSAEYEPLSQTAFVKKELEDLEKTIPEEHLGKMKTKNFKEKLFLRKTLALLHAHMDRKEIPPSLKADYTSVLMDAPRLLSSMMEMTVQRGINVPAFQRNIFTVLSFVQCITQRVWFNANPLRQLPHLDEDDVESLKKYGKVKTLNDFKLLSDDVKKDCCKDIKAAQWKDINEAASRLPSIDLEAKCYVEGEEGIYEGDIMRITIDLFRLSTQELRDGKRGDHHLAKKKESLKVASLRKSRLAQLEGEELMDELPAAKIDQPPEKITYAYAPYLPYPKVERWYIYLKKADRIITIAKVAEFSASTSLNIDMKAPNAGLHELTVHVTCDSYLGMEKEVKLTMEVFPHEVLELKRKEENPADEAEEEPAPEPNLMENGFWDYVVMVLLVVFAYNWLQSKGYWALYITPYVDKFVKLVEPITNKVYPVIKPVFDPTWEFIVFGYDWLANALHREAPPANFERS